MQTLSSLTALSPLDGRYARQCEVLRGIFSESAFMNARVRVEVEWLIALSEAGFEELAPISAHGQAFLRGLADNFTESDCEEIKTIEARTNHDVKAVEYWIKEKVAHDEVSAYGIVDLQGVKPNPGDDVKIKSIVEKPSVEEAPSDYAVVGRYVLPAEIWPLFKRTPLGAGGEFQLTDTIDLLMGIEPVNAYAIVGHSRDCGNKEGYVKTFIEYALRHPEIGPKIKEFLKEMCAKNREQTVENQEVSDKK